MQLTMSIPRTQRRLFHVSKFQLRQLLWRDGLAMPETTWQRFWKKNNLPSKLGMSEETFAKKQIFYLDDFTKLKAIIGFDDVDLFDL